MMQFRMTRLSAPSRLLGALAALLVVTTVAAGVARRTDVGASRLVAPEPVRAIDLTFQDRTDGAIVVTDVKLGTTLSVVAPGRDGFVRVALRSLAFDRRATGHGSDVPFRLGEDAGGRLWLTDLATGRVLLLDAYGGNNAVAFARFLETRSAQR